MRERDVIGADGVVDLFDEIGQSGDRDAMVLFVVRQEREHAVRMHDLGT